jgi:hypothetical protein
MDETQAGWKAIGKRTHRGHVIEETIGTFLSWIDADQACDAYHQQHRQSLTCSIERDHKEDGE